MNWVEKRVRWGVVLVFGLIAAISILGLALRVRRSLRGGDGEGPHPTSRPAR